MINKKELVNAGFRVACHAGISAIRSGIAYFSGPRGKKFANSTLGKGVITAGLGFAVPQISQNEILGQVASEARILGLAGTAIGAAEAVFTKDKKDEKDETKADAEG